MKPGGSPHWGHGGKSAVGTALGDSSHVWFTMSRGALTEIYWPRPDIAQTRGMFFVVTDRDGFFSDERVHTVQATRMPETGIPLYETRNRSHDNRYAIEKIVFADPDRNVVIQRVRFEPMQAGLRLWAILLPGLENRAYGNNAEYDRRANALVTWRAKNALALKASCPFALAGCAYEGPDDALSRLKAGRPVEVLEVRVTDGVVMLAAELDCSACQSEIVLALAFAPTRREAIRSAAESLVHSPDELSASYASAWRRYRTECDGAEPNSDDPVYEASIAVLQSHQSKNPPGGIVASLGTPWADSRQQILDFRYPLSWTRDAVEAAGAFLELGDTRSAVAAWEFLKRTLQKDGHWAQNMWLDGKPHWNGIQMDETALPILLADMLRRRTLILAAETWPTVKQAASYIVRKGPGTEEDRWEQDGGYSPYTLAIEIAALLAAADLADIVGESETAKYLRAIADYWNDNVERWTFLEGHYVRLSTPRWNQIGEPEEMEVQREQHAHSPAALALVRFGLRAADDPRMVSTIEDIDRLLKTETATGPIWRRYPKDRYGEYPDGRAFDGHGVGRGWPLLAGERAHYEIARGNIAEARRLASTISKQTSECGFIPEQVWDAPDLPGMKLFNGRPSGSAMPLVWAHAEYLKLRRSIREGAIFDMPPQPVERYQQRRIKAEHAIWSKQHKISSIPAGKTLRMQFEKPAVAYWTPDAWSTVHCEEARLLSLNIYYCDAATAALPAGVKIQLTIYWSADKCWEERAYTLHIEGINTVD